MNQSKTSMTKKEFEQKVKEVEEGISLCVCNKRATVKKENKNNCIVITATCTCRRKVTVPVFKPHNNQQ